LSYTVLARHNPLLVLFERGFHAPSALVREAHVSQQPGCFGIKIRCQRIPAHFFEPETNERSGQRCLTGHQVGVCGSRRTTGYTCSTRPTRCWPLSIVGPRGEHGYQSVSTLARGLPARDLGVSVLLLPDWFSARVPGHHPFLSKIFQACWHSPGQNVRWRMLQVQICAAWVPGKVAHVCLRGWCERTSLYTPARCAYSCLPSYFTGAARSVVTGEGMLSRIYSDFPGQMSQVANTPAQRAPMTITPYIR